LQCRDTWVRPHLRHKDKAAPDVLKVVYIKASLSEARARVEKFRSRAVGGDSGSASVHSAARLGNIRRPRSPKNARMPQWGPSGCPRTASF